MDISTFTNSSDLFSLDEVQEFFTQSKVTIAMQKRNGRKCITTITGMADDLDLKMILSHIKKTHNCNGAIIKDEKYGEIITLSGDQRENFFNFLIQEQINKTEDIIVKGT
jgi:translation initiation factor 1